VTTGTERLLLLDCRSFVAFNTNHICGAFNASCGDRFTRKRLAAGRAGIADIVTGGPEHCEDGQTVDIRERYRQAAERIAAMADGYFVVYDDNAEELCSLPATHPLHLLTDMLNKAGHRTKYLRGGLQAFYGAYRSLCSRPETQPSQPFLYSPTTPVIDNDVDSAEISQILPFLFIGNQRDAQNRDLLGRLGITHVLNVTSHLPTHFEDVIAYLRCPANDNCGQNIKQYFNDAISFIEAARCTGGRILVHCQGGVSRSPSIVLAYIIARYDRSLMEAFQFVKSQRQIIAPNFNFLGQLLDFEQRCRRGEFLSALRNEAALEPLTTDGSA